MYINYLSDPNVTFIINIIIIQAFQDTSFRRNKDSDNNEVFIIRNVSTTSEIARHICNGLSLELLVPFWQKTIEIIKSWEETGQWSFLHAEK